MTQLVAAHYLINWLCKKTAVEELNTKSVAEIVKAKRVVFKVIVLNKVDNYIEMVRLEWTTMAA